MDFTPSSRSALTTALSIANLFESEIHVIHVVPEKKATTKGQDVVRMEMLNKVQMLLQEVEDKGIKFEAPIVSFGIPWNEIHKQALNLDANVIMLGYGDKKEGGKYSLGVTSEKLIQKALKPVWIVSPETRDTIETILCPVDFSGHSRRGLINAIHLARYVHAELVIMMVIQPLSNFYAGVGRVSPREEEGYLKEIKTHLEKFLNGFDMAEVSYKSIIRQGKIHQEILETARAEKAGLIIMGVEQRTGLTRLLTGGVAERILSDLPCSFITVKGEDAIRLQVDTEIGDMKAHYEQGQELLKKGFPKEAVREFEMCTEIDPMNMAAWEALAQAHQRLGNLDHADKYFNKAKNIQREKWEQQVATEVKQGLLKH